MRARLSADAEADLKAIRAYLEPINATGMERVLAAIFTTIAQLERFPLMGRPGRVAATHEITVPRTPFFVVYTITDETFIDVERILHTRRGYPLSD